MRISSNRMAGSKLGEMIHAIINRGRRKKHELIILDDIFPHLLSAFRIAEYNSLLRHFETAAVYSNAISFCALGETRTYDEVHAEYAHIHPDTATRVHYFNGKKKVSAKLCYVTFLQNADLFLNYITKCKLPFVLELYPGGGFQLNVDSSNQKLHRVLSSPLLRKVIVTQKISRDYLLGMNACRPELVELVYGGVFPLDQLTATKQTERRFPAGKTSFDVCFVAHKYMPQGRDKGYDVFIETAKILAKSHPQSLFHVVGPYGHDDADVSELGERIRFYGTRTTDFFPEFYGMMDIILSPNTPFLLMPGAFDGFPTGACIEAACCGVAVFCTDELKLNPFIDGEELVVIPRDPVRIADIIGDYIQHPERLHRISRQGRQRFNQTFSLRNQMEPRIKLLEQCLQET